ncbi:hypothetical protein, partial [Burkholderia sp. BCC1988]|uniref:hypothetical protein n=1 Tax=Burkholderia sp. BCC1988 TaxID=2817443 RepID=UPI002AB0D3E1
ISSLPSSAHTYRLLIFKEHVCEDPEVFSAALRFQQQRSEIMNRLFQFVNNFLTASLRRLGFNFQHRRDRYDPPDSTASLLLPRRVSVSAKEA